MTDKLEESKIIIAKLLISKLFNEWEQRSEEDLFANIKKMSEELSLGLTPSVWIKRMERYGLMYNNMDHEGCRYFSTKKV